MIKRNNSRMRKQLFAILFCSVICLSAFSLFVIPVSSTSDYIDYNAGTNTFTVYPSGADDTENIQAVFDAAKDTGPGTTVLMTAGVFTITGPILAVNFDGLFTGEGKDATVIQTSPDIPFALPEPPFHNAPFMFTFMQDDDGFPTIKISDMTLFARGEAMPWGAHSATGFKWLNGIRIFGLWTGVEDSALGSVNTNFERVHFEGEEVDWSWSGFNLLNGIGVWGEDFFIVEDGSTLYKSARQQVGNHKVTDCSFERNVFGMNHLGQLNSDILIEGNTFNDVRFPIYLSDQSNSDIRVTENVMTNVRNFGIWYEQSFGSVIGLDLGPFGELPDTSRLLIDKNEIHCIHPADGISLYDYSFFVGESCRLDAVITNNKIVLEGTYYGAIYGFGVSDVLVTNNKVSGYGAVGIYAGINGVWDIASSWTIMGNNFQTLDAFFVSIYLGPGTSGCAVIGGLTSAIVYDEGTDNLIVGVNTTGGNSPGQTLSDALAEKMALISHFR